ncbi:hypothetical protein GCM10027259_23190 [Micromonospora palomenae]
MERGAPKRIDEQTPMCVIARGDPRFLGKPFSCWSLSKLRDYLIEAGYVTTISVETVRRILHERGCPGMPPALDEPSRNHDPGEPARRHHRRAPRRRPRR